MPFFQNLSAREFISTITLGNRSLQYSFKCPSHPGRASSELVASTATGLVDLGGDDASGNPKATLTLHFTASGGPPYATINVDVSEAVVDASKVYVSELAAALNANAQFSAYFTASSSNHTSSSKNCLLIERKNQSLRFYVANGGMETVLGFNTAAPVVELPSFMSQHAIGGNRNDGLEMLVLDPGNDIDALVISNSKDSAGRSYNHDPESPKADWQLFKGRKGFVFTKNTVDGSNRVTAKIEYDAGSEVGDFAVQTQYVYDDADTTPSSIVELPYTLTEGDLVTPA